MFKGACVLSPHVKFTVTGKNYAASKARGRRTDFCRSSRVATFTTAGTDGDFPF